jgi:hypothetical protein
MTPFTSSRFMVVAAFLVMGSVTGRGLAQVITIDLNNPAGNYDLANPLSWEPNYTPPGPTTTGRIILPRDPSGTQYQKEFTMSNDWSIGTLEVAFGFIEGRSIDFLGNTLSTNLKISGRPGVELRNGKFVGSINQMIFFDHVQFEGDLNTDFLPFSQVEGTINSTQLNGGSFFGPGTNITVASIGANQANVRQPSGGIDVRGGTVQTNQTIAELLDVHSGGQFTSTETQVRTVRASGAGTEVDLGTFKGYDSIYFRGPASVQVTDGAHVRFGLDFVGTAFDVSGAGSKLTVESTGGTRRWGFRRSDVTDGGEVDFGGEFSLDSISSTLRVDGGTVKGDFTITGGDLDLKNAELVGSLITLKEGRLLGSGHFTGSIASDVFAFFRAVILPEGTLSFAGNFSSFAPIEFDFRSTSDIDRIKIGGQMFTFPFMKIRFANGFRGSVGDEIEFVHADGGLANTGVPVGAISLLNVPTGYAFLTQADANSVFLRITAVPEVSSSALAVIGVIAGAIFTYRRRPG